MKKLATLLALAALLFVGCSEEPVTASGNKNSTTLSSSSLVGTWKNATTSYTFTSAGKLTVTSSGTPLPAVNWTLKGDTLFLEGTPSYTLKLSGSTLSFYSSGQKLMDLVKEGSTTGKDSTVNLGTLGTSLIGTWDNQDMVFLFTADKKGVLQIPDLSSSESNPWTKPFTWTTRNDTIFIPDVDTMKVAVKGDSLLVYVDGKVDMVFKKVNVSITEAMLIGTWESGTTTMTFTEEFCEYNGVEKEWSLKYDTLKIGTDAVYTVQLSGSTLSLYKKGVKAMSLTKSAAIAFKNNWLDSGVEWSSYTLDSNYNWLESNGYDTIAPIIFKGPLHKDAVWAGATATHVFKSLPEFDSATIWYESTVELAVGLSNKRNVWTLESIHLPATTKRSSYTIQYQDFYMSIPLEGWDSIDFMFFNLPENTDTFKIYAIQFH